SEKQKPGALRAGQQGPTSPTQPLPQSVPRLCGPPPPSWLALQRSSCRARALRLLAAPSLPATSSRQGPPSDVRVHPEEAWLAQSGREAERMDQLKTLGSRMCDGTTRQA